MGTSVTQMSVARGHLVRNRHPLGGFLWLGTGFRLADDLLPLPAGDVVVVFVPGRQLLAVAASGEPTSTATSDLLTELRRQLLGSQKSGRRRD